MFINNRYARQIALNDIGIEGQKKIEKSRILVCGIGGLGTFSSMLLAEMGVGFLRIVDRDIVQTTNLHRTPLYHTDDLDKAKVEAASRRLKLINPKIIIDARAENISEENIDELLDGIDVVVDGLDSFHTRKIVNRACRSKKIPYVFAGVLAHTGNVTVFNTSREDSPCLSCIYHSVDDDSLPTCDIQGIHPALLAVITGIQVHETIKIILGQSIPLDGKLLFVDLKSQSYDTIQISKSPTCPICSTITEKKTEKRVVDDETPIELCGNGGFIFHLSQVKDIDLQLLKEKLQKEMQIKNEGTFALTFVIPAEKTKLTIFKGGNILISGEITKDHAKDVLRKLKHLISTNS